jgi:predicted component of type VI protein secretion system
MSGDHAFFLVGANVKPCFVNPKQPISMGRAMENTIVLTSPYVSRKHATIQADPKGYRIVDQGSTNGTFVNGQKIKEHHLSVGDKIRIGSFVINFLDKQTLLDQYGEFADIATINELLTTEIKPGPRSDFSGSLSHLNPIELIQMVNLGKKTGTLSILHSQGHEGTMRVRSGEIFWASYTAAGAVREGEHAVYQILKLTEGSFVFKAGDPDSSDPNVRMSTMNVLMEGCRMIDEGEI